MKLGYYLCVGLANVLGIAVTLLLTGLWRPPALPGGPLGLVALVSTPFVLLLGASVLGTRPISGVVVTVATAACLFVGIRGYYSTFWDPYADRHGELDALALLLYPAIQSCFVVPALVVSLVDRLTSNRRAKSR